MDRNLHAERFPKAFTMNAIARSRLGSIATSWPLRQI
jgi:hypothetical protein